MIEFYSIFLLTVMAYFIGSIPTAVWVGKYFFGVDVREYGSGNAGSTNTFRVLGAKAGIPVQVIDILKGFFAASLAGIFYRNFGFFDASSYTMLRIIFGLAAVVGHIFPIYEDFKGGKGINTLLGMMIAIHPWATLACVISFLVVLVVSKYVSLGSIIGTLTFPLFLIVSAVMFHYDRRQEVLIIFGFAIFILVVLTHQKNIKRLLKGEENKMRLNLWRRK
jgi:glycerol-3-phosphate acyltransferase PlsY